MKTPFHLLNAGLVGIHLLKKPLYFSCFEIFVKVSFVLFKPIQRG